MITDSSNFINSFLILSFLSQIEFNINVILSSDYSSIFLKLDLTLSIITIKCEIFFSSDLISSSKLSLFFNLRTKLILPTFNSTTSLIRILSFKIYQWDKYRMT
jgi:hypothetical protein